MSGFPADAEAEDFVHDLITGRRCLECGEPHAAPEPCEACAEKRELLRQGVPALHGDA